jgi:hypothetical protein
MRCHARNAGPASHASISASVNPTSRHSLRHTASWPVNVYIARTSKHHNVGNWRNAAAATLLTNGRLNPCNAIQSISLSHRSHDHHAAE